MKGIVFTEFLDRLEEEHGPLFPEELLADLPLASGGAYTAVGTYDACELLRIADALALATHAELSTVLRDFGRHLFGALMRRFPEATARYTEPLDLMLDVERLIHPTVQRFHPDAELPQFRAERDESGVQLIYRSRYPLADLAHGLLEGCLGYFGVDGFVRMDDEPGGARFEVVLPVTAGTGDR